MKNSIVAVIALSAWQTFAAPSSNDFHSVTNDWYNGNFTNVYELAQMRLSANTNDIVGACLMMEFDTCFSDFSAMSNSFSRLIRAADLITSPQEFADHYARLRDGYVYFRDVFLPAQKEEVSAEEQAKDKTQRTHLLCSRTLELIWKNGLW